MRVVLLSAHDAHRHRRWREGLVAASMVDLSALRGLVAVLTRLPTLACCHENRLACPDGRLQFRAIPCAAAIRLCD